MHGADMDIQWLQRDFGIYVVNLFDTGQASRVLGLPRYSLAFLLQYCCDVQAEKQYQLADWRIRCARLSSAFHVQKMRKLCHCHFCST